MRVKADSYSLAATAFFGCLHAVQSSGDLGCLSQDEIFIEFPDPDVIKM